MNENVLAVIAERARLDDNEETLELVAEVRRLRAGLGALQSWWIEHYGHIGQHLDQPAPFTYASDVFALLPTLAEALPPHPVAR